jgi:hypothetical protein
MTTATKPVIGAPVDRVDGPLKVTVAAAGAPSWRPHVPSRAT